MRKFRPCLLIISMLLICLMLPGCDSSHVSHFKAVALVRTGDSDSGSLSFYKLSGKYVFKMKSDDDECIRYKGEIEDGTIKVYCDNGGTMTDLFSLESGEEVDDKSEPLEKGTTYIIIETDGEVENGKLEFEIK